MWREKTLHRTIMDILEMAPYKCGAAVSTKSIMGASAARHQRRQNLGKQMCDLEYS